MSDNLKNVAKLVIAEYADSDRLYVKITFDPIQGDAILNEEDLPVSYQLMQQVFHGSVLAELARKAPLTPVPEGATIQ